MTAPPNRSRQVVVPLTPAESEAFIQSWRARLMANARNVGRKAVEAVEAMRRGES